MAIQQAPIVFELKMENTKSKRRWMLLMILCAIAKEGFADKSTNISKLLSSGKDVRLSENGSNENLYHLENNEINAERGVDVVTKETGEMTENDTFLSNLATASDLNVDYSLHRGDTDVFDDYNILSVNETFTSFGQAAKHLKGNGSEKSHELKLSSSTISWLESFMFLYRNWQWVLFNTFFMIIWIFFAIFALYRLIGLYWCCVIFSRSLYLVLHLLIFTAATFSIVQLLHLSYGNHQGLPLFLTLLLTHTPSPCLALACSIVIRSILAAANVTMYRRYLPSLVHVGIFSSIALFLSFIGDVAVGISHSSITLVVFRVVVNTLCMMPLILFLYKYVKIRRTHNYLQKEFVRELKSLVPSQRSNSCENGIDARSTLRSVLNPWAKLTIISVGSGIVMLFCNFCLSLFFTIANVSLALFWVLHSVQFLSQIVLVILITAGATLTLTNVTRRNICRRYFIIPLPTTESNGGPFVQHGNFIYQRVSVNNIVNCSTQPNNFSIEPNDITPNNIIGSSVERPKVSVRRSATFNCPPRAPYMHTPQPYTNPVHSVLSDHLLCTYPIDEREVVDTHNCDLQCRNKYNYSRIANINPYSKPVRDSDEYPISPGKFPIMGCNGKSRYGSLHSLPNISPRIRTQPTNFLYHNVNESEPFITTIPEGTVNPNVSAISGNTVEIPMDDSQTGSCVKDIIMENPNLFRSHSLRQSSLRRKIRNRERVTIRTVPSQNISMNNASCSPTLGDKTDCPKTESATQIEVSPLDTSNIELGSIYPKEINDSKFPYYNGVQNCNFYCQNSSESNSLHKVEVHVYDQPSSQEDIEVPNGGPIYLQNGINGDIVFQATAEVSSIKVDATPEYDQTNRETADYKDMIYYPKEIIANDEIEYCSNENEVDEDFSASTLPSQKRASLKRNHSSASFETKNLPNGHVQPDPIVLKNSNYGNNWYGTWAGRKSKRRTAIPTNEGSALQAHLRKLSSSKSSLSNLYDKLKPRKYKSSMTSIDTLDVEETIENELVIVEKEIDSEEETLPKISEDIDLASEILKSSSMLADFLVNKEPDEMHETNFKSLDDVSLESLALEIKT